MSADLWITLLGEMRAGSRRRRVAVMTTNPYAYPGPENLPPVGSDADLFQRWRSLMGPLGFSRRRLWILFLAPDGRVAPVLPTIDDVSGRADTGDCGPVVRICADVLESNLPGGSVAILYSRPGRGPVSEDDRTWARGLAAAAAREGVRLWPVHFANDEILQVFAPDDLIASPA